MPHVRAMGGRATDLQTFSALAEIVEVIHDAGRRFVKVVFTTPVILDVTESGADEPHLGDRVVAHGWFGVEKEDV